MSKISIADTDQETSVSSKSIETKNYISCFNFLSVNYVQFFAIYQVQNNNKWTSYILEMMCFRSGDDIACFSHQMKVSKVQPKQQQNGKNFNLTETPNWERNVIIFYLYFNRGNYLLILIGFSRTNKNENSSQ